MQCVEEVESEVLLHLMLVVVVVVVACSHDVHMTMEVEGNNRKESASLEDAVLLKGVESCRSATER